MGEREWIIVECEAYGDETDLASHTAVYHKSRGEIMRRDPGHLYVYLSYGVHHCMNFVTHEPGKAGAVLIRALEPSEHSAEVDLRACSGPGKLTRTLGIDLTWDNRDVVTSGDIAVFEREASRSVAISRRIGITRSVDLPWRYFDPESPSISGRRAHNAQVIASPP
jgi:DNA-3-methyladenine glycosylase